MQRKDVNMANPILHFSVEISTSCPFRSILRGANQKHVSRSCCGQVKSTGSSLPKAERDITLSTFVAQDIRDRRLLPFRFRLSGGQLRHTCRSPAYHVLDQKSQNSRLTRRLANASTILAFIIATS
jgi:hypothetical protein